MVQVADDFDAREEDLKDGFEPLPDGEYKAIITNSDLKMTKKGDGDYYKFEYEIIDGAFKGRKVWQMLTRNNPSEKATLIGRKQFAGLKLALDKPVIKDTVELHNRPLMIKVKVDGEYNRIVNFEALTKPKKTKIEKQDISLEEDEISFA
jgi:hypothetical protein